MSIVRPDVSAEYAVMVGGVGWVEVSNLSPSNITVGVDAPTVFNDRSDAEVVVRLISSEYTRLGLSHVTQGVELVVRTISVTRSDWLGAA